MNKAVFFDRDGTLIKDKQHLCEVEKIELLDGVIEGLQTLCKKNFLLFIITNQSGVGRGLFPESKVHEIHNALLQKFLAHHIAFHGIFYCPHHPDNRCICRKPSPHFIHTAQAAHHIDISRSFFVGDKDSDAETGKNAGMKTTVIKGSYDIIQPHLIDFLAGNFSEAVEWILEHTHE